jgi:hypothetical protein
MSTKRSKSSARPRRLKTPIEPIHLEELLAGAGMNGFLGVLDTPVLAPHLFSATPSPSDAKVESVVLKMEALMDLIEVARTKGGVVKRC